MYLLSTLELALVDVGVPIVAADGAVGVAVTATGTLLRDGRVQAVAEEAVFHLGRGQRVGDDGGRQDKDEKEFHDA